MSGINQKPGGSFPYVIRFRFLIHDLAGQWGGPGHVKLSPMRALTDVPPSPVNLLLPWSWQTPEGFALRGWRSPASGKPVLHFIHGTGMCGLTYWPVLEQLLPQVDLFISDLHGHGDSDGQAPFVGWNRSAELALAAWQAHAPHYGPVETIAAGHSLGAVISAMMLGSTPGVFNRGLLLDPVIMPPLMRALGWLGERTGLYARNTLAQRGHGRAGSSGPAASTRATTCTSAAFSVAGAHRRWPPMSTMRWTTLSMAVASSSARRRSRPISSAACRKACGRCWTRWRCRWMC
jgi:Predicted hydrolases or acyltransferases (alpha/beta hydrolase superfamily)